MADASAPWEGAADPALVARLVRPATRPGLSDGSHGAAIAGRILRMTDRLPLLEGLSARHGSAALGGDRPPVVHARPAAPAAASGAGDLGAAATPSVSPSPSAPASPARPVVRAVERAAAPAFPPVRPMAGGGAVQRSPDPAAPLPLAPARRSLPGAPSSPAMPVAAPAATRLQRAVAADAAPTAGAGRSAALPVVSAAPVASGRAGSPAARAPQTSSSVGTAGGSVIQRSPAPGAASVVQRSPAPGAPTAPRATSAAETAAIAGGASRGAASPTATLPTVVAASAGASAAAPTRPVVTAPRAAAGATPVQRMPAGPTPTPGLPSRPVVTASPVAPGTVQRALAASGATSVAAAFGTAPTTTLVHAGRPGGGAATGAQTIAAGAAPAGTIQRTPDASSTAAAPTLPTRTALPESAPAPDAARIADQVYEMLVRRLADERRLRGG